MSGNPLYNDAPTPMLKQYMQIKASYPDSILMFRLGDFYEMFFDDAVLASKILDITLTSRNRNDPNPVPLCGVPYHSVEPYIAKLLENGKKVAICDQVEDPALAKGIVKREVTRVATPGVVPDGLGLDAGSSNFVAAIIQDNDVFGVAFADISTGVFHANEFPSKRHVLEELCRIEPREILLPRALAAGKDLSPEILHRIPSVAFTYLPEGHFDSGAISHLEGAPFLLNKRPASALAAAAVFSYFNETQKGRTTHIRAITSDAAQRIMRLDEATQRNLELAQTMKGKGRIGSLLDAIDRTKTAPGARKLKEWLLYPLTDPAKIVERLDAVEVIINEALLLKQLPDMLGRIYDLERIISRVAMGFANARDMVGLAKSLFTAKELKETLKEAKGLLGIQAERIAPNEALAAEIERTLDDEPPIGIRDGGLIREGVSAELDELKDIVAHGKDYLARLEAKEREATGIGSLKIRYNKVFGYYLEVTNTHRDKVPREYIRKQTLANAERYITEELKEYEGKILGAEEKIRGLEYSIFRNLREKAAAGAEDILETADAVATIDVLDSFARIAAEYDYKRPEINGGDIIDIREGRHPIVERQNPAVRFVPNDVYLNNTDNLIIMITGPNMAGKSTVMRQTALIVLMAQIGSFVPAQSACIGVVDRIFTRVGASDALAEGKSTFMVEMSEAAAILNEATSHSLIIIDEIGRGTSTFDGLAIAWAVAEDIHDRVRARTMFATHYHELTELALTKPGIRNMNIAVREWNGEIIFLRRLVSGATSRSYGIAVAKLAGLPKGVIERAGEILANLESGELDNVGRPRLALHHDTKEEAQAVQYQLFSTSLPHEVAKRLKETDTQTITPIEALNILHELKGKL